MTIGDSRNDWIMKKLFHISPASQRIPCLYRNTFAANELCRLCILIVRMNLDLNYDRFDVNPGKKRRKLSYVIAFSSSGIKPLLSFSSAASAADQVFIFQELEIKLRIQRESFEQCAYPAPCL